MPVVRAAILVCAALTLVGCGDDENASADARAAVDAATVDARLPPDADPLRPETLEDTGLYADFAGEVLADGVVEYTPQFELWSDGASKRRWVLLPAGTTIDTSDMDFWTYPVGTKLWKEFTRGTTRVETRLLYKTGADQWYMMAYAWNAAQTEALAVEDGVVDALGTEHDIPDTNACQKCHARTPDKVLGFSAIQLDHDAPGLDLEALVDGGHLSDPPNGNAPYFSLPGAAADQAALGYMHGNCGGCHNAQSDVLDVVPLQLRLEVSKLANVQMTPAYVTAYDVDSELTKIDPGVLKLIDPAGKETSVVWQRMNRRDMKGMPPEGSEVVDTDGGLADVGAWIDGL